MEESSQPPIPLQFQLLYNWEEVQDVISKPRVFPAFKIQINQTAVYRLIHHEFERHYISAGQIFKANGLTLTEGLFLFNLKMTDFDVDFLVPQFPFCDIWVSVEQARDMAMAFGIEQELSLLLGSELDPYFSSDNIGRNEMMHNWTIPIIPHLQYSTRALLEATFDVVESSTRKVRTQISKSKQTGMVMKDRTETGLVRWQVWAYEQFLQQNESQDQPLSILDRSGAVWDALQGIFSDLQTLSRGGQFGSRVLPDTMMVGNMPLKKEYLGHSLLLQQLYIAVMAEKIMNELVQIPRQSVTATKPTNTKSSVISSEGVTMESASTSNDRTDSNNMLLHDRMDLIEQELYRTKRKSKKRWEEMEVLHENLTQQLNEFARWKAQSEQARKSERVWMLTVTFCVLFGVLSLRTFYSTF